MSFRRFASKRRRRSRFESLESRRVLATFFVDTVADHTAGTCAADNQAGNASCTIRRAIEQADANPGADVIQIADGNYILDASLGALDVSSIEDISFVGNPNNPAAVVIDGNNQTRVFDVAGFVWTSQATVKCQPWMHCESSMR